MIYRVDKEAKLTDFGLSRIKNETSSTKTKSDRSVGTLAWMAAELLTLKPKYGKASDMYAYGMILLELASREVPFEGVDPITIRQGIKDGETEEIPEEVEACYPSYAKLIKWCVNTKPDKFLRIPVNCFILNWG